jgi:hypothetical protein
MYFTRQLGTVCHLLDEIAGRAPFPCGARLEKIALIRLRAGEPSRFITAEKPANLPLCKHCRKSQSKPHGLTSEIEPEMQTLRQPALASA